MKRLFLVLLPISLFVFSCEDEQSEDTTPPTVNITSPQTGSTVSDSITITCMSSDNEGVEKVELWVNGVSTDISDNTEPYSFDWNITTVEDGSFTIIVRSYDLSGNTTDSEPITLVVYKTVELWGVVYSVDSTTQLNLSFDYLTGSIPPQIGLLTNLTTLNLSDNELTGEIPPETGNLTNLTYLGLHYNQLTGNIPPEIGNLTNLTTLYLDANQLTGSIPSQIGNLTSLTFLDLRNNQLTGSIPPEIGNLTNLTYLNLRSNQLTGEISSEIGNMTNLTSLILDDNQLTGSIPPEIGNLTNLTDLYLYNNQLTGEIPESICDLNNVLVGDFGLSGNQLCPPYPSCVLEEGYGGQDSVGEQDTSNCD